MKLLLLSLIAAFSLNSAAWSETVPVDQAREIVVAGEVLGSRSVANPSFGFELLIRHNEELYYCFVTLEKTFAGDNMTKVGGCWDETNNL
ncbi:hypothetical protein [Thalassobacter stenotrophicus]|uniref:hypothetical protein n=1 Tax=Thalassobacter stenotrophicus TaxID=266809 RepID=UPI00126A2FA9|nr:hypothetical protein [Thalassobacter stenotrophicus]